VLRFLRELSDAEIDYADTPALAEQTAQQIVDFEFPEDEQARIYELVARDPSTLSHEEELELGLFLYIEQVLVILKLRSMRLVDRSRDRTHVVESGMCGMCEGALNKGMCREEILRWQQEQLRNPTRTVEDLIAAAVQTGEIIEGINDSETLKDLGTIGISVGRESAYTRDQLTSLIDRWATRRPR